MADLKKAVFPGSFDPLTCGHTDIARRALGVFDRVVVAVLSNPAKETLFTVKERVKLIEEEFSDCGERIEVKSFSGLLVDFVHRVDAKVILRGLRAISDYDYEAQIALMNKNLALDVETLFMMTSANSSYVSSTLVKQVARFGGEVAGLVPEGVERALKEKFS